MQIHGPTHVHGPQPISAPHRMSNAEPTRAGGPVGGLDELDISHEAELASRVRDVPEIRTDRVAEIRAAIEAGDYETPAKREIAVGRLLDEISV